MAIFCTIYYILSYIESIPQIIKLIKTKSSNDYSLGMVCIQLIAIISWTIYIFTSVQNIIVYIGTVIDLILLLFIDFLIFRYYKFNKIIDGQFFNIRGGHLWKIKKNYMKMHLL